jgi:ferrochelatase
MAKESTYVLELNRTAKLVCEKLGKKAWALAYSSRSGNPSEAWLVPDVCDAIRGEAARGAKDILLITIGFVADHVEVLFDQDVEAREAAENAGIGFHRAQTVGDHRAFIRMVVDVIRKRMTSEEAPEQRQSRLTRFADGSLTTAPGRSSTICYCFPAGPHPPCTSVTRSRTN